MENITPTYKTVEFELVHNDSVKFYKLFINGKCQFDEFTEEAEKQKTNKDAIAHIYRWMEYYSPSRILPSTKFKKIDGSKDDRDDIWEFKQGKIRIYVIRIDPNMIIVFGGYKKNQKKDIKNLMHRVSSFNI